LILHSKIRRKVASCVHLRNT